jgi:hypothetical protein
MRRELRFCYFKGEIMKRLFSVVVAGCVLGVLWLGSVGAQEPGTKIRVSIPFDFTVKGKTLPAGEYEVSRVMDQPIALLLRNVHDKRGEVVVETGPVIGRLMPRRDELIFNRYGDSYFLSEVFTAGEQTGEELYPTHKERELKR